MTKKVMKAAPSKHSEKTEAQAIRSGLARDLNNILSTIEGSTEMILAQAGDDMNLRLHAARILRASRDAAAMLKGIKPDASPAPARSKPAPKEPKNSA